MDKIEKIKAEIKRLREIQCSPMLLCDDLLSFIDYIQEEPVSEEDEAHIESLLKRLEGICKPGAAFISTRFAISEDEDWLKSLKDRVQPLPKQEWSNWDKTIIESIEALCDEKIESVVFQDIKEHANDIKEWLKDLKDRYTWEPSDKQMEAVRIAAEIGTANNSWAMDVLKSMYQDLKKLKE